MRYQAAASHIWLVVLILRIPKTDRPLAVPLLFSLGLGDLRCMADVSLWCSWLAGKKPAGVGAVRTPHLSASFHARRDRFDQRRPESFRRRARTPCDPWRNRPDQRLLSSIVRPDAATSRLRRPRRYGQTSPPPAVRIRLEWPSLSKKPGIRGAFIPPEMIGVD